MQPAITAERPRLAHLASIRCRGVSVEGEVDTQRFSYLYACGAAVACDEHQDGKCVEHVRAADDLLDGVPVALGVLGMPGRPVLTVMNTGEPVQAEAVPRLFEPFRRLASDRTHRGTVEARPGSTGGLVVDVDLPSVP